MECTKCPGVAVHVHRCAGSHASAPQRQESGRIDVSLVRDEDNTVAIAERSWQLDKSRFRNTLAGATVTIHEHLDGTVSIRWGPHTVGRFDAQGKSLQPSAKKGRAA